MNLWPAVYGDYMVNYGRTISLAQSPLPDGAEREPIEFFGPTGNTLVAGMAFGRIWPTGNPVNLITSEGNEAKRAYLQECVDLRQAARDWLEFGYLQRPVQMLTEIPDVPIMDPKKRPSMPGKLKGTFTARVDGKGQWQATGDIYIHDAKLYRLPIMLGFLHLIHLSLPGEAAFKTGHLAYSLKGGQLDLRRMYLTGDSLSVAGLGEIDLDTQQLDLTFITGPPARAPKLTGLAEELLKVFTRVFMEVKVTGTVSRPRMTPVPMSSAQKILRAVLTPGN